MNIEQLRKLCLSFPGATEEIQWEDDLLFKVGGKMFAITPLEPARVWLTLKANLEEFAELTERPGVIPAPYLARAKWISVEGQDTLPNSEVERLLRTSYGQVVAKLPVKIRASLASRSASSAKRKARPGKNRKKRR